MNADSKLLRTLGGLLSFVGLMIVLAIVLAYRTVDSIARKIKKKA